MDELVKLLKKATKKDREKLLVVLEKLRSGVVSGLQISKLKGEERYRVRVGRFRIMFHFEGKPKRIVIDVVRKRDEKTYHE